MTVEIRATVTDYTATATIETRNAPDAVRYVQRWSGGAGLGEEVAKAIGKAVEVIRYGHDPAGWQAIPL